MSPLVVMSSCVVVEIEQASRPKGAMKWFKSPNPKATLKVYIRSFFGFGSLKSLNVTTMDMFDLHFID